jgi:UTP--glucose-1-phosphate uridylyltransferase
LTLRAALATLAAFLMEIRKALITAAGKNQRTLPLQSLVDRDGLTKTALAIVIEEILRSGIEQIGVVIMPGDAAAYRVAAGAHAERLTFIEQSAPLGYAHAIHCAAEFCGDDAFLLLVCDHLYLSAIDKGCAQQLVEMARAENCAVSAVQSTHESKLPYYGAVGGRLVNAAQRLYQVEAVLEKPTPTEAEQKLDVPGLRAGYYLCFFGMHVLTPALQRILGELLIAAKGRESTVNFRAALARLAAHERYLACELEGRRYDFGVRYGLLTAQLALALSGKDRDEVLRGLVELLAQK